MLGTPVESLLGFGFGDAFGRKLIHDVKNAINQGTLNRRSSWAGVHVVSGKPVELHAFESNGTSVVEFEPRVDPGLGSSDAITVLQFLMQQQNSCGSQSALFKKTVGLLRHLTGYDRVMVYRFDSNFNGEIVAESCEREIESFLGLRFPHWDIPAQAREIMKKLPIRFISNVDQKPVQLVATDPDAMALDITQASCRGVSSIHMQYLRNMQTKATMTLSILVAGRLWGMISFHHRQAKIPPPKIREILTAFGEFFAMKVHAFQKEERLALVSYVDDFKQKLLKQVENDKTLADALPKIAPMVQQVVDCSGIVVITGSRVVSSGRVPERVLLDLLRKSVEAAPERILKIHSLIESHPDLASSFNGCAGVLAVADPSGRAFFMFREEQPRSITWAGNPQKKIEVTAGTTRLTPRGSFAAYLQTVNGSCKEWADGDVYFANRIWMLVKAAEGQALLNTMNRKQKLMIDELNHRVRNILSLVRSVSKQARRRNGSIPSYTRSLESRIMALAAAHDIASGSSLKAVEVKALIRQELAPYLSDEAADIIGSNTYIRAENAPIFALVIHELVTNAAKYGALSNGNGHVSVELVCRDGNVLIIWREVGGPVVHPPEEPGFGTRLIENAIQYELGGETELEFEPDGVEARLILPAAVLETSSAARSVAKATKPDVAQGKPLSAQGIEGFALVVEDNFIIAQEMVEQLEDIGFSTVETRSNPVDALMLLEREIPAIAFLDFNLGMNRTSIPIAERLLEMQVPFLFVTGYGVALEVPKSMVAVRRLTKPVSEAELREAISIEL